MISNGNNSTDILCEVEPEQTEIFYPIKSFYTSSECLDHTQVSFYNEYKNECETTEIVKHDVEEPVLKMENFFSNHTNGLNMKLNVKTEITALEHTSFNIKRSTDCDESISQKYLVNTNENKINHKCAVCRKGFKRNCDMVKHMVCHTDERNYECDICTKRFKTKCNLVDHIKCHTDERNYKCDICPKSFKTCSNLLGHVKSHMDERIHKCNICTKDFKSRREATDHTKCHNDETNHKCDICAKHFKTKSNKLNHMQRHTDERNHKCDVCSKSFKTKRDMRHHMKRHSDKRNYKCDICGNCFKRRVDMVQHLKTHSDERNHKCGVCTKNFKRRREVVAHMRCHTDERNYKCDICAKSFKKKCNLVDHLKSHTDERLHKCNVCPKGFKTKRTLLVHMKYHNIERTNHECNVRAKRFKTSGNVVKHMKSHIDEFKMKNKVLHEIKKRTGAHFQCCICRVSFFLENDFKSHTEQSCNIEKDENITDEDSLQKLPYETHLRGDNVKKCTQSIMQESNVNIKQEVMEIDVANGFETNPATIYIEHQIKCPDFKTESMEMLHFSETNSNSIIVKEEETTITSKKADIENHYNGRIKCEGLTDGGNDMCQNTFDF